MASGDTGSSAARPGPPLSAYGHLLTIYLVWGAAYLAVKVAISGPAVITVLQLQTARVWGAGLLLALLAAFRNGLPRNISRRDVGICVASGLLMWISGNGLATLASKHSASIFVVMALGAIPIWACLLDLVIERAIPTRRVVMGLALGLFGLFLVTAPALFGGRTIIEPGYEVLTVLILIGAGVTWSLGTIVQRPLMGRIAPEWAAAFQTFSAAVVLSVFVVVEGAPIPLPPSQSQWLAFGFMVVFGSVIGLTSYIRVLRNFSPVIASTFAYVNPIVGVLLGWLILDERPAPLSLVGLAIVLTSIAIILTRPQQQPA